MIRIRTIQHYMYCPRRFALLELNCDWEENIFTAKAGIMHERVHSGEHEIKSKNKIELSSVTVYNDELSLYGITDCIEFQKSKDGTYIPQFDGNYKVKLIEYKPTQPKNNDIRETDAIQVFAQKICADYIWHCDSEGYIYYCDTRKRVRLSFDVEYQEYYDMIMKLLGEMKECLAKGVIPEKKQGQKCSGCSVKDLCMPKKHKYNVKKEVMDI